MDRRQGQRFCIGAAHTTKLILHRPETEELSKKPIAIGDK